MNGANQPQQKPQQIQIRANDSDLKGRYSNLVQIKSAKEEFVFDFLGITPPMGALVSRIYMSPPHVKRMAGLLNQLVSQYEKQFGAIEEAREPMQKIGFQTEK